MSAKPSTAAASGAHAQTTASRPISPQRTPAPTASAVPATAKTRIWIVEVGTRSRLKSVVSANATPITTACAETESLASVSPAPTRRSTAWLANVAPSSTSGAISRSAGRARIAPSACGIPIVAPV